MWDGQESSGCATFLWKGLSNLLSYTLVRCVLLGARAPGMIDSCLCSHVGASPALGCLCASRCPLPACLCSCSGTGSVLCVSACGFSTSIRDVSLYVQLAVRGQGGGWAGPAGKSQSPWEHCWQPGGLFCLCLAFRLEQGHFWTAEPALEDMEQVPT